MAIVVMAARFGAGLDAPVFDEHALDR